MEDEIAVDVVWSRMGTKLEHMLTSFTEQDSTSAKLDRPEWMRMYTDVYDICVHQTQEYAADLYERLRDLLIGQLQAQQQAIVPCRGEDLVRQYCQRFDAFVKATSYIRRITEYMHRFWIPQQISDGPSEANIRELNVLVLVEWERVVLRKVELLLPVMFDLIDRARSGDRVDWDVLSGVIRSFATVGSSNVDEPNHLYTTCFEEEFLKRAHDYYKTAAEEFLSKNTVPDYMRQVDVWLQEEEDRADSHLQKETKPKLQAQCTKVLIDDFKDTYIQEFVGLVEGNARPDLTIMHKLLKRSKDSHKPGDSTSLVRTVAKKLEALISEEGRKMIKAKTDEVVSDIKSFDQVKKCLPLIKDLTELHDKYKGLVEQCFDASHIFVQTLDQAFKKFVNTSVGGFNMSELLAYYCDYLMRSNNRSTESEMERKLDKIVRLFCYLEDKDLFHESYRRWLSKRLLNRRESNTDLEHMMITKLKENAGFSFTSKLEGMFNDITTSSEIIRKFKEHSEKLAAHGGTPSSGPASSSAAGNART